MATATNQTQPGGSVYDPNQPNATWGGTPVNVATSGPTFNNTAQPTTPQPLTSADYSQLNPAGPQATAAKAANPSLGATAWTPGTTGNIQDPTYAASLIAYYAQQPGADPSLANDPNYWIQKMTSGAFGSDQNYAISKMQNGWKETPSGSSGTAGAGTANLAPYVPPAYAPAPYTPTGTVGQPGFTQQLTNNLYEAQSGRASQNLNVDPNDPIIKGQTDAFAARQTQALRQNLAADAERVGPNANIGAEARQGSEAAGQATSQFQAGLMSNELAARRTEIQQALTGMQGMVTAEQQQQLQEELAQLDRAQQQFQFTTGNAQQESQFGRTLANNAYQFDINDQFRNSPLAA